MKSQQSNGPAEATTLRKGVVFLLTAIGGLGYLLLAPAVEFIERIEAWLVARGWDEYGSMTILVSSALVYYVPLLIVIPALSWLFRKPATRVIESVPSVGRALDRCALSGGTPHSRRSLSWILFCISAFFVTFALFSGIETYGLTGDIARAVVDGLFMMLLGLMTITWPMEIRIGVDRVCAQCDYVVDTLALCPECGSDLNMPDAVANGRLWATEVRRIAFSIVLVLLAMRFIWLWIA